jgi:hypothetical protein
MEIFTNAFEFSRADDFFVELTAIRTSASSTRELDPLLNELVFPQVTIISFFWGLNVGS